MPRVLPLVLALLLVAPAPAPAFELPGVRRAAAADERHAEAFAVALRDAIASGDGRRVAPLFPQGGPAWTWLGARWAEMRRGTLDPKTWEVSFEPFYARPDRLGGVLTLTAREARDRATTAQFPVEALRRGKVWVVGDAIALDRPDARVDRHDLRVDLRRAGRLVAEDVLTIAPTGPDRRFFLRLDPALRVGTAQAAGRPVPFRQRGDLVFLELPATAEPYDLSLAYEGAAPTAGPERVAAGEARLADGWAWYPRPAGLPVPAVFRLMAMTPPGRLVAAGGDFVGVDRYADGWLHHWTTPAPAPGIGLLAGELQRVEALAGKLRVGVAVRAGHEAAVPGLAAEAVQVMGFLGKRYGAWPADEIDMAEAGEEALDEPTGAIALPSGAFERAEAREAVLAPAIARRWAGRRTYRGTAGERAFMVEGVAGYLAMLQRAERGGQAGFRTRLAEAQARYARLAGTAADVPLAQAVPGADREAWLTLVADKGAVVMNMLRRRVGPEAFDQALKTLYAGPPGTPVTLADFRAAFERASNVSLTAFFAQWLGREGRPELAAEEVTVRALPGGRFEVSGTLVQGTARPFHLVVPLVVGLDGQPRLFEVEIKAPATAFKLVVRGRPRALLVDPLRDTLAASGSDLELAAPR